MFIACCLLKLLRIYLYQHEFVELKGYNLVGLVRKFILILKLALVWLLGDPGVWFLYF